MERDQGRSPMNTSLEAIEAVRSAREAAHRTRHWRLGERLGRINARAGMISLLFLVVVGLFVVNSLEVTTRQSMAVDGLGVRARMVDDAATVLAGSIAAYGTTLGGILAGSTPATAIQARMATQAAQLSAAVLALEQAAPAEIDPAAIALGRESLARLPALADRVQQALGGRRRGETAPLHEEWLDAQSGLQRLVEAARETTRIRAEAEVSAARRAARDARIVTLAAAALGVAATILVWLIVVVMITRPMTLLHRAMVRIARGDVTTPVPLTEREDQLGLMARALLVFRDNLNVVRSLAERALDGARQTTEAGAAASQVAARLAQDLAGQRESMHGFATALGDAAGTMRRLGETAQDARDSAGDARLLIDDSRQRLRGLGEALARAAEDPDRTRRLTAALVDLATQANALAARAAMGADGADGGTAFARDAQAFAARTRAVAIEIAETLDALGDRLRDAGASMIDIAGSTERLEQRATDAVRLTVALAAALPGDPPALRELGERFDALAESGTGQAADADRVAATMTALAQVAQEMRAAVEAVAAGARLGRNS